MSTTMRLFETIVNANHRALAGDSSAGLHPSEFTESLPIVALTCIDVRLNPLMPGVLGIPEEHFIWLRNAGNIIFDPMSSMMRTLALACAIKGGREIAIIGHTDCRVRQTSASQLMDRFKELGVERAQLPDNLNEFFGLFSSERQNVIRAVDFARSSPLIGPKIPVHGLLVDIQSGKLEWLVNGYQTLNTVVSQFTAATKNPMPQLADFHLGEMKFPETKIGETIAQAKEWLSQSSMAEIGEITQKFKPDDSEPTSKPPQIPSPPSIRTVSSLKRPKIKI